MIGLRPSNRLCLSHIRPQQRPTHESGTCSLVRFVAFSISEHLLQFKSKETRKKYSYTVNIDLNISYKTTFFFLQNTIPNWVNSCSILMKFVSTKAKQIGTGYEYDGNVFVAWVLQVRRAEVVTK